MSWGRPTASPRHRSGPRASRGRPPRASARLRTRWPRAAPSSTSSTRSSAASEVSNRCSPPSTLAAFLGQIGLPGGGFVHGLGSMGDYGVGRASTRCRRLPQGANPVPEYIPCARIADLLLGPGADLPYDGRVLRLPDIRLAYWAGGNPFHHHQDLRRLRRALPGWTRSWCTRRTGRPPPSTPTSSFRSRAASSATTWRRVPATPGCARSPRATGPYARGPRGALDLRAARRAARLRPRRGARRATAGSSGSTRSGGPRPVRRRPRRSRTSGATAASTWRAELYRDPVFTAFRADPDAHPLQTPSGRIELWSRSIADAALPDIGPHAEWREPRRWWRSPEAREFDLHLLCNQPTPPAAQPAGHGWREPLHQGRRARADPA